MGFTTLQARDAIFTPPEREILSLYPPSAAEARGGNGRQTYFVCWRSGSAFGAMVVVSASVGRGSMRDAKRAKALQLKKQQMEVRIQEVGGV